MTTPAQPDPIVCPDCHQTRPPLNLIHQCHGCIGCAVHDQDETTGTPHPGPADELRAAAQLLRERATAPYVQPGPWHVHEAYGFLRVDNDRDKTSEAWTVKSGADVAEENRGTAEWIALMHPGVGEALADWLEATADYCTVSVTHPTHVVRALAVARALLGGES